MKDFLLSTDYMTRAKIQFFRGEQNNLRAVNKKEMNYQAVV